jgi:hypothetical protein
MHPESGQSRSVVELIGTKACQVLSPGSRGHVLAGRSRAVYLRSTDGELVWLAPGDVPMHRRGIRLAAGLPHGSTGSTYRVTNDGSLVGVAMEIDLRSAATWDPLPPGARANLVPADDDWHRRLAGAILRDLPEPRGFGVMLPGILDPSQIACACRMATRFDGSVPDQVLRAVVGIAGACRGHDLPRILVQAEDLVGLGDGLTPSGDDFLGGLLFGLSVLRRGHGGHSWCSSGSLRLFIQWSKPRTNEISHCLLRDHADGHGSDALERFALGLLERWSRREIRAAATALIGLGHSTGWSLMAGVWTALALARSREERTQSRPSPTPMPAMC